jgi:hypothetical protein
MFDAFYPRRSDGGDSPHIHPALPLLVKRLQESLTRMEPFEVVTVGQGADGEFDQYHPRM